MPATQARSTSCFLPSRRARRNAGPGSPRKDRGRAPRAESPHWKAGARRAIMAFDLTPSSDRQRVAAVSWLVMVAVVALGCDPQSIDRVSIGDGAAGRDGAADRSSDRPAGGAGGGSGGDGGSGGSPPDVGVDTPVDPP